MRRCAWPVLPADWTWGQVIGIFADSRGHVWMSSRSRISEWDPQGRLVQSWDARGPDGETIDFEGTHTFSDEQVEWFRSGSALNVFRRKVSAGD